MDKLSGVSGESIGVTYRERAVQVQGSEFASLAG
jgi:hypothetical protein